MLFGYPPEANEDNWVHDCIYEILTTVHSDLSAGIDPPSWNDIIPAEHFEEFAPRSGIESRLATYIAAFKELSAVEKEQVALALESQNDIEQLLCCKADCKEIAELPESIQDPAVDLFTFVFKKLTDFGVREKQYAVIFEQATNKVCPFCGIERFNKPGTQKEDEDHYLPKSRFPFAGANLWNLVPMGKKCNGTYKRNQSVLHKDGVRRRAFNPFGSVQVKVSLIASDPFNGCRPNIPNWEISFEPPCQEAETWDEVFSIRRRYVDNELDVSYMSWLREFVRFCSRNPVECEDQLFAAINDYVNFCMGFGLDDRGFLRVAVFELLAHQCLNGNKRLTAVLMDAVGAKNDRNESDRHLSN